MNIVIRLISDLFTIICAIACWVSCIGYNKDKKTNYLILTIILTFGIYLISLIVKNPLKLLSIYILLIAGNYIVISKNMKKAIIGVIISQTIVLIVEFIFAFVCSIVMKNGFNNLNNQLYLMLILDSSIMLITFALIKIKVTQKTFNIIDKITSSIKSSETLIYLFMIIFIIITSLTESYMNLPIQVVLITNAIMAIVFITITLRMSKIKSNFNKIDSKYQTSMTSLKEYELMIDKFRISNHENKNELQIIRNMIKDKKTIKYIDALIDNKIKDNETIMKQTVKIPEGGLRATIYSKMCLMEKYKINYKLNIAKNIRTTDLINLDETTILSICKIMGVFLDNAIETTIDLKEKYITIEIYKIDNCLYIEITNNFENKFNINKISKPKYTTKGEDHGYGLSLVEKIISENSKILENERFINGNTFTQTLKIRM